jgi:hypothetical protein
MTEFSIDGTIRISAVPLIGAFFYVMCDKLTVNTSVCMSLDEILNESVRKTIFLLMKKSFPLMVLPSTCHSTFVWAQLFGHDPFQHFWV